MSLRDRGRQRHLLNAPTVSVCAVSSSIERPTGDTVILLLDADVVAIVTLPLGIEVER